LLIAEIGLAHEGSLGLAMSYVKTLKNLGVTTCKFQMHMADAESSPHEKFRIPFSTQDKSRESYWRRTEFTFSEWKALKAYCDELEIEFLCSPFSLSAIDCLEALQVKRYKLGSAEAICPIMLKKLGETKKPVIVSTGLSSEWHIQDAIDKIGQNNLTLLHCISSYPAIPEQIDLSIISKLRQRYRVPVGLSDHSGNPLTALVAFFLGADLVEFHSVFDKRQFGPDSSASLDMKQVEFLQSNVEFVKALSSPSIKNEFKEHISNTFSRSLGLRKPLAKGQKIDINDLEIKKPGGMGIDNVDYINVIGKQAKHQLEKYSFLNWEDIDD
jgi:N-acetylneuraminate synthase